MVKLSTQPIIQYSPTTCMHLTQTEHIIKLDSAPDHLPVRSPVDPLKLAQNWKDYQSII